MAHTGKRVDTECFYTEEEAEKYCRWNVGITEHNDGTYEEHEMHYEEIEERTDMLIIDKNFKNPNYGYWCTLVVIYIITRNMA